MNKIIIIGSVGQDLTSKTTANGQTFYSGSLATSKKWIDKNTQEKREETTWHNFSMGDRFEKVAQYIQKGSKIAITGEQKHLSYTDDNGNKKFYSRVDVQEVELLDSPREQQPQQQNSQQQQSNNDINDNDIPF